MQHSTTADVQRKVGGYHYEATSAYLADGILHATVMRFKMFGRERRYYGTARRIAWPLTDLQITWRDERPERGGVAA